MTPRDRVTRALTFSRPDRVPRHLWNLGETSVRPFERLGPVPERGRP